MRRSSHDLRIFEPPSEREGDRLRWKEPANDSTEISERYKRILTHRFAEPSPGKGLRKEPANDSTKITERHKRILTHRFAEPSPGKGLRKEPANDSTEISERHKRILTHRFAEPSPGKGLREGVCEWRLGDLNIVHKNAAAKMFEMPIFI